MNYCQVWLSCADEPEAKKISDVLLKKRLIACAKQMPINSTFHWKGGTDSSNEILLVMESREDLFEEIETEVARLHSYETFVLQAVSLSRLSSGAQEWLDDNLKS